MNITAVERGVLVWIRGSCGVSGVTVYFAEPNAPRPDLPAVSMKIISGPRMVGFDGIIPAEIDVQAVTFSTTPDAGSFRFAYGEDETELIEFDDDADAIQEKVRAMSGFDRVVVVGSFEDGLSLILDGLAEPELVTVADNTLMDGVDAVDVEVEDDPTSAGDMFRVSGPRPFTLSINAYGPQAAQIIQNIQSSISDRKKMLGLHASNLSALNALAPRDLSTFVDSHWEPRWQMDVEMMAAEDFITDLGSIETIEMTSDVGGHDSEMEIDADDA